MSKLPSDSGKVDVFDKLKGEFSHMKHSNRAHKGHSTRRKGLNSKQKGMAMEMAGKMKKGY